MDIEPGTVVANRYRISRPLGRGGMGEVFAAENLRTGRPVAVKLLRSDTKGKSSAVARFRQEARAAGSINSDHVTQVLDVEEDRDHGVVLVFELLEGESLIERLKRTGPIPFDELHPIIEQVWIGLADAHKVGIVHRDLKPSNVFLEKRPDGITRVKILDFGISKLPKEMGGETLTEMGQSLGTFSFMPPEQIGKAKTVDHRADIYACATLIYQSLTGQLPYQARNILVMVEMKSKSDARKLSEAMGGPVDPRLEAYVALALSRDPAKRHQTANEALAAWRELKNAGPSQRREQFASEASHQQPISSSPSGERVRPASSPVLPSGGSMLIVPAVLPRLGRDSSPELSVEATSDETAATLAMPMAHLTSHGLGAPEPPRLSPRLESSPLSDARRQVSPHAATMPQPPTDPSSGPVILGSHSSNGPGAGRMGAQSGVGLGGTQPVMLVRPMPAIVDKPVERPARSEESTFQESKSGNLTPHPAGYYIPSAVVASLVKPAEQTPQPGAPMGDSGLPRVFDDPTSLPASSSEKTHVYRRGATDPALQSSTDLASVRQTGNDLARHQPPPQKRGVPLILVLLGFLLVGFGVVALLMRFMRH